MGGGLSSPGFRWVLNGLSTLATLCRSHHGQPGNSNGEVESLAPHRR